MRRDLLQPYSIAVLALAICLPCIPPELYGFPFTLQTQSQDPSSNPPQPPLPQAAESKAEPAPDSKLILKAGTPVRLRFLRRISSSNVIAGEKVNLEVVEDISVGDSLVIAKSSLAQATVTEALPKGAMGQGGDLEFKIETVRLTGGQLAPLRFVQDLKGGNRKGVTPTGAVLGALTGAGYLVYYVSGKDAVVQKGTEVTAYVDQDVLIDSSKLAAPPPRENGRLETKKDEGVAR